MAIVMFILYYVIVINNEIFNNSKEINSKMDANDNLQRGEKLAGEQILQFNHNSNSVIHFNLQWSNLNNMLVMEIIAIHLSDIRACKTIWNIRLNIL